MKILVAEDDATSRHLLRAVLERWGYDVTEARDGTEAWALLSGPDAATLAILDWVMPGVDGIDICRRLRRRATPYVYTILLTGRTTQDDVVEGLDAGADDYVTKPFDSNELRVRLRAGRRILELQAQLLSAQTVLLEEAQHDPLTGLWDRTRGFTRLDMELSRSQRERSDVSVMMADLDHFKDVNDTHGHMAGDAVLRESARRIRDSLRPYDVVARYGGEEFLIVLPGCDEPSADGLARRVLALIGDRPVNTSEGVIPVTVSVGTATAVAGWPGAEALVRAADAALYRAKRAGRNRVEQTTPEELAAAVAASIGTPGRERTTTG